MSNTKSCILLIVILSLIDSILSRSHNSCIIEDNQMDYLKLSVQWQPGYCHRSGCSADQSFTIHGLWPGSDDNKFSPSSCCTEENFDPSKLRDLEDRLSEAWPSLSGDNWWFWRHEFDKHGSCTRDLPGLKSLKEYFEKTLKMFDALDLDNQIRLDDIKPSNSQGYPKEDLVRILTSNHDGRRPDLECDNGSYLREIRFCYDHITQEPIDCPDVMDRCESSIILLES